VKTGIVQLLYGPTWHVCIFIAWANILRLILWL